MMKSDIYNYEFSIGEIIDIRYDENDLMYIKIQDENSTVEIYIPEDIIFKINGSFFIYNPVYKYIVDIVIGCGYNFKDFKNMIKEYK